jgi:hypothetical protein
MNPACYLECTMPKQTNKNAGVSTIQHEPDLYETALRSRVSAWQAALDAYLAAKASERALPEPGRPGSIVSATPAVAFDLPVGALRSKSLPDAIVLYLAAGRRKQTNKEIATGVLAGGFQTGARNLESSVAATLFRLRKTGIVLRFPDGWDLAEHYPEHIRKKLEPSEAGASKKPRRRRRVTKGKAQQTKLAEVHSGAA